MGVNQNIPRISFIIGSMRRGGAERVISILANHYADRGWNVDILTLLDNSNDYVLNENVYVKPICNEVESRIRQLPKWLASIRQHVIEHRPDVIVSFIARINIVTILACLGLNKHIIISERSDPMEDGRSLFVRCATQMLYPLAASIVFQTKWAQSCFTKKIQRNSVIIPNPIFVSVQATNVKENKIVAVGRLTKEKNHAMLINAFHGIYDEHPDYQLYIYGEGPLREELTTQVREMSLLENVFLPGSVHDIHERIADAEIFVLTSNYEGLSNALLEAMMMGLPCISTCCSGSREVIKNHHNGLLTDIGDEAQLSQAIRKLIEDKSYAGKLGMQARQSVKHMNSSNVLSLWNGIIENKECM